MSFFRVAISAFLWSDKGISMVVLKSKEPFSFPRLETCGRKSHFECVKKRADRPRSVGRSLHTCLKSRLEINPQDTPHRPPFEARVAKPQDTP